MLPAPMNPMVAMAEQLRTAARIGKVPVPRGKIDCDVKDTGSFDIPAAMVDKQREIQNDGLVSCTEDGDCSPPKKCQADLSCK